MIQHSWKNTAATLTIRLSVIATLSLPTHILLRHLLPGHWWMLVFASGAIALSKIDLKLIDLAKVG